MLWELDNYLFYYSLLSFLMDCISFFFLNKIICFLFILLQCVWVMWMPQMLLGIGWARLHLKWNSFLLPGKVARTVFCYAAKSRLLAPPIAPAAAWLWCPAHPGQAPWWDALTPSPSASVRRPFWLEMFSIFSIFQSFVVNNQFKPAPSLSFCNSKNPLNYIVGRKQ